LSFFTGASFILHYRLKPTFEEAQFARLGLAPVLYVGSCSRIMEFASNHRRHRKHEQQQEAQYSQRAKHQNMERKIKDAIIMPIVVDQL
jgi:hypothetical protein